LSGNISGRGNDVGVLLHGADSDISRIWASNNIGVSCRQLGVLKSILEFDVIRVYGESIMELAKKKVGQMSTKENNHMRIIRKK
jgi:hypothetical protein